MALFLSSSRPVMESELKLRLAKRHNAAFKRRLDALATVSAERTELHDVYFDTPELELARRDSGLRIRGQLGAYRQTLKLGQLGGAGLHVREEFETDISGPRLEPERIADPATRDWALAQGHALAPVFETRIRRTRWLVDYADARIEVVLDCGRIVGAQRRADVNEVELELIDGSLGAVFALAQALAQTLPLLPETGNKAATGYALFRGDDASPSLARVPPLTPHMTPFETVAAMMREALRHLLENLAPALRDENAIEFVHQARIALRRLRLADAELNRIVAQDDNDERADALALYSQRLGTVRDLDVFIHETLPGLTGALAADTAVLLPALRRWREHALAQARRALGAPGFARLTLALLARLHQTPAADHGEALRSFVPLQLDRHARRVHKLADAWKRLAEEERHDLRKRIKKLRYLSEFFSSLYGGKSTRRFLAPIQRLQQELGEGNDIAVGEKLLLQLEAREPELAEVTARILDVLQRQARRRLRPRDVRLPRRRDEFWRTRRHRGRNAG